MPGVRKVSFLIVLRFCTHVELLDFVFFNFIDANAVPLLLFSPSIISSFILQVILSNGFLNKGDKVFNIQVSGAVILMIP